MAPGLIMPISEREYMRDPDRPEPSEEDYAVAREILRDARVPGFEGPADKLFRWEVLEFAWPWVTSFIVAMIPTAVVQWWPVFVFFFVATLLGCAMVYDAPPRRWRRRR